MNTEDQALVIKALANPNDFAAIVDKYERKIDSYVKSIIYASIEDREDIVQDIFIAAYRFLNSYKPEFSFSTWLYRIAHNQAMSFLRKHKSRFSSEYVSSTAEDEDIINNTISDEDVEKNVAHLLDIQRVKGQMDKLSVQDREVLLLRYCEQKEYAEISSIFQVPEGTIASIIHRAKNKLKLLLKDGKTK